MLILFSCKKLIQLTMKQWKAEWGAPLELALGSSNARGVAILLRNGFDCKIKESYVDPAGRYIGIQAQINDENYYLFNVYGPNNDNQAALFYDHLLTVLKKEDLAISFIHLFNLA